MTTSSHALRRRFLLALGVSTLVSAACGKKRVVQNPPPPPPQPSGRCYYGSGQANAGQPTALPPFDQCKAEQVFDGCPPARAPFNETDTRMARQRDGTACCYDNVPSNECRPMRGRAFRMDVASPPTHAPVARRDDWSEAASLEAVVDDVTRTRLRQAWLADARAEHASVAAFSLLSMQLLQLGAPADLVRSAHEAALEEIEHAQICFGIASGYAEAALGPGPLDIEGSVASCRLVDLAVSTLIDGCYGETAAALEADEAARLSSSPALSAALSQIAGDETRHAELAWRIVAWCVKVGGEEVLSALEAATDSLVPGRPDVDEAGLERFGRLGSTARMAIGEQCLADVVRPCVTALRRI